MKIAVVGASNNPEKFGFQIVRHMAEEGHIVYPVNLHEKFILGLSVYKKVADIETRIDIVNIVVPPEVTLEILKQLRDMNKINVWIQPGAESDEVIKYLNSHINDFGTVTYNRCITTSLDQVYPRQ